MSKSLRHSILSGEAAEPVDLWIGGSELVLDADSTRLLREEKIQYACSCTPDEVAEAANVLCYVIDQTNLQLVAETAVRDSIRLHLFL
jgi:hypothetical protein